MCSCFELYSVENSIPETVVTPYFLPAETNSSSPATVLWSQSATASAQFHLAFKTISVGENVPSENVECVCKSQNIKFLRYKMEWDNFTHSILAYTVCKFNADEYFTQAFSVSLQGRQCDLLRF